VLQQKEVPDSGEAANVPIESIEEQTNIIPDTA
jgi:hypothetical protein